ncbi:hypothetical protein COV23_02015 [Candidatus Wolfebacteria bacterium CG10_big_fil_rev_8_21_14_0_10_31_9]|uniref:Baseplate protein J-like barrel domain-containing protein n=1 Tax=Candidatus Wolfebacteria bacterium CG10_big_fil_rev_8_21_14_0_10_31_9 TaxID=1975070 RepID=A0A2H0RC23_9BACT|nr:MAG: hypothetical protein COV23_02015 [Candidatus Wolfebacteria bacterium CG10_big_fil_rev_8_21_14_0_10_31_9]
MAISKDKKIKVIDIIRKSSESSEVKLERIKVEPNTEIKKEIEPTPILKDEKSKGKQTQKFSLPQKQEALEKHIIERRIDDDDEEEDFKKEKSFRPYLVALVILIALALAGYLAVSVLPRVDIKLIAQKAKWPANTNYTNPITLNSKIADVDILNRQIPVAIFSQKKNINFQWLATAKKNIQRNATGKIIIYNNFGSDAQTLVVGTRFQTPDGKIFKLTDKVIIPGKTSSAPASIEADVIAEKPGEAYNISPVKKFTVPGFADSPKFEKFYGESKNSMTGGLIGESAYPSDADITKAKIEAEKSIKDVINTFLYSQFSQDDFKVIESSRQVNIIKEVVNKTTDENGNFSIYVEAEGTVQAFKEAQLLSLMSALAVQVIDKDFVLKDYQIDYGDMTTDAKTKIISLPITFSGNFWKPIDVSDFKNKITGKSEDDLKAVIFTSSIIEKADVSFWPFWVKSVPNNLNRVKVEVN